MKKINAISMIAILVFFSSCGLISDLIPDVDTTFEKIIPVDIEDNSGYTDADTIDLESSGDYSEFEGNIDGFKINEIRFDILNYNVPPDMYFTATIHAISEDGTESVIPGKISSSLLRSLAEDEKENEVEEISEGLDKVIEWLDSPGRFIVKLSYELKDASGNPYPVEGEGYRFDIKIIFDVTVITGI